MPLSRGSLSACARCHHFAAPLPFHRLVRPSALGMRAVLHPLPRSFERDENPIHPAAVAEPKPCCPPPQGPLSCQARRRPRSMRRMRLLSGVTTPAPSACPLFADQRLARPEPQPALSRPARQLRAAERAKPHWQALRGFLRWRLLLFSGQKTPSRKIGKVAAIPKYSIFRKCRGLNRRFQATCKGASETTNLCMCAFRHIIQPFRHIPATIDNL